MEIFKGLFCDKCLKLPAKVIKENLEKRTGDKIIYLKKDEKDSTDKEVL